MARGQNRMLCALIVQKGGGAVRGKAPSIRFNPSERLGEVATGELGKQPQALSRLDAHAPTFKPPESCVSWAQPHFAADIDMNGSALTEITPDKGVVPRLPPNISN